MIFAIFALVAYLVVDIIAYNPFPGYDWVAEHIDLGNGGDKTFYVLLKCRKCTSPAPLVLWLNGGPGVSSMVALFINTGPVLFNGTSQQFEGNPYTFADYMDIMYVDNPVGVPFSIVKNESTYCKDEYCVSRNLYAFYIKFIKLHPEYIKRPLYLAGESYAGHFVPAFGKYLTEANNPDIDFRGVAIGDGMINIYQQIPSNPEYLLERQKIGTLMYVGFKAWVYICDIAHKNQIGMLDRICTDTIFIFASIAGLPDPYDIENKNATDPSIYGKWFAYMNSNDLKSAFNVMDQIYSPASKEAADAMRDDFAYPLSSHIGYMLDNGKKVILWFGDLDYVCNYIGGLYVANNVEWVGAEYFRHAEIKPWMNSENEKIGEIKTMARFTYLKVYGGGHGIFAKKPKSGLKILTDLIKD